MITTETPLRIARKSRGWSQADLAEKALTSAATVGNLERAKSWPRRRTAYNLARVLWTDVEILFPGIDDYDPECVGLLRRRARAAYLQPAC